jgi:hypothetical protein
MLKEKISSAIFVSEIQLLPALGLYSLRQYRHRSQRKNQTEMIGPLSMRSWPNGRGSSNPS